MGGIYSRLTRPIRTFNIENRAEKIISKKKPVPAPQYASAKKQKELANEVHPGFLDKHHQKNKQLDQRLKEVFVTSVDPQHISPGTKEKSKLLPQSRHSTHDFNIDFYEPAVIPKGKCTLRQAFTFISRHKNDPIKYNSENIAAEYKIDEKIINDILKYFKIYMSIVPNEPDKPISDPFQELMDQSFAKYEKHKEDQAKKIA